MKTDTNEITPKRFVNTLSILHLYFGIFLVGFGVFAYWLQGDWTYDLSSLDFLFPFLVPILAILGVIAGTFVFKNHLRNLEDKNDLRSKLVGYQGASVIKYAFIEGPALLGLVAAMKSGNLIYLAIAGILILYFVFQRPTKDKIERDLNLTGELKHQFQKQNERIN